MARQPRIERVGIGTEKGDGVIIRLKQIIPPSPFPPFLSYASNPPENKSSQLLFENGFSRHGAKPVAAFQAGSIDACAVVSNGFGQSVACMRDEGAGGTVPVSWLTPT